LQWEETMGDESKEFVNYMRKREKQEKARGAVPSSSRNQCEKYIEKMKKQLHGYAIPSSTEFLLC
jgi:U3 small nucleolar ribonucleoprotein protein LCP5